MQYEIDFLPVGESSKWWDAITVRYGDFSDRSKFKVIVIDGGIKGSWKEVVNHITKYYGTNKVDAVVATHLHQDHIWWLWTVLEELEVWKLVMHIPWNHSQSLKKMTTTQMAISNLEEKLEKSLNGISNLEDIANNKKIPIVELFAWDSIFDELLILWPSKEYYEQLLANFTTTPTVKPENKIQNSSLMQIIKNAIEWIEESLDIETLTDDYEDTNPENNSSLILFLQLDDRRILFTWDAGKWWLNKAIEFADNNGLNVSEIDFLDVPHHGSKRNVWPTILDRLKPKVAFISCPKDGDPKHPSRKVINALIRRWSKVFTTKWYIKNHWNTTRDGWSAATPEEFYNTVEE